MKPGHLCVRWVYASFSRVPRFAAQRVFREILRNKWYVFKSGVCNRKETQLVISLHLRCVTLKLNSQFLLIKLFIPRNGLSCVNCVTSGRGISQLLLSGWKIHFGTVKSGYFANHLFSWLDSKFISSRERVQIFSSLNSHLKRLFSLLRRPSCELCNRSALYVSVLFYRTTGISDRTIKRTLCWWISTGNRRAGQFFVTVSSCWWCYYAIQPVIWFCISTIAVWVRRLKRNRRRGGTNLILRSILRPIHRPKCSLLQHLLPVFLSFVFGEF